MAITNVGKLYSERYSRDQEQHVYPVEFVVRAFLGTYPELKIDRSKFPGSRVLDLGFGDGRNMPLLRNLGFQIYGVEIHENILQTVRERLPNIGVSAELAVGSNVSIPFEDDFFDYILACHSCYYVEDGTTFSDNLQEIRRVIKREGVLVCSLPMPDTYLLKGAESLGNGHWRITYDPYGLRTGAIFRAFESQDEIIAEFGSAFTDFKIGFCDDHYWGIRQKVWIVVCTKAITCNRS